MDPWRTLVEDFVNGRLDAPTFERRYIELYRLEAVRGASIRFAVDQLFYEVDAYCADPALRGPQDIDQVELQRAAEKALRDWDLPWPPIP
jgi:hypothetical protein